jgi:hypothetical protein
MQMVIVFKFTHRRRIVGFDYFPKRLDLLYCRLVCEVVYSGRILPALRRNVLFPSSVLRNQSIKQIGFHRNVCEHIQDYYK